MSRTNRTTPDNSIDIRVSAKASQCRKVRAGAEGGEATLLVDESVYGREALLRTCYWFTDRCYLFVSPAGPNQFSVRIRAKAGGPALESISGEFENALIDQQVRQDIERDTSRIREMIVAKAFAEGQDLDDPPVGDDRDPVELAKSKEGRRDGES
jgi:His-Xaa-Ser system protein HxsD